MPQNALRVQTSRKCARWGNSEVHDRAAVAAERSGADGCRQSWLHQSPCSQAKQTRHCPGKALLTSTRVQARTQRPRSDCRLRPQSDTCFNMRRARAQHCPAHQKAVGGLLFCGTGSHTGSHAGSHRSARCQGASASARASRRRCRWRPRAWPPARRPRARPCARCRRTPACARRARCLAPPLALECALLACTAGPARHCPSVPAPRSAGTRTRVERSHLLRVRTARSCCLQAVIWVCWLG
jgi:hypothetical protein